VIEYWETNRLTGTLGAISVSFGGTGVLSGLKQPLTHQRTEGGEFEQVTTDVLPVGWEVKVNAHVVVLIIEDVSQD
jgi:hypothetical protein